MRVSGNAAFLVVVSLSVLACAGPRPASETSAGQPAVQSPTGPKRIVGVTQGNPPGAYRRLDPTSSERGVAEVATLLNSNLTIFDSNGDQHPRLGEAVPSIENGLWRLLPDGRMETSWKIRSGAVWHDGTPFTTDDLVFTLTVLRDRELPTLRHRSYTFLEGVEATDGQTITVRWNKPYIQADQLFSDDVAMPLPKHLLEQSYAEDKANLLQLPYWTTDYVGLGPYRVKEWERASHILVQANDSYLPGRPRVDEIEIRMIADANAIVANLLAGSVDILLGRSISVDHVVQLRERMPGFKFDMPLTSLQVINSQFLDPSPAVVTELNFRRAMIHAIDRQEMADTIDYGLVPVAHHFIYPNLPEARATESALVKYDYDPRRAAQLMEGLGYVKGVDGFYRDAGGQQLRVEIRTTQSEINPKSMAAVADYLQRLGVAIDPVIIPVQLVSDQRYRATFPGLIVNGGPADSSGFEDFHSGQARVPESNYTGSNRARYSNPEMDSLVERYQTTIAFDARMEVARQITRHVTENLPVVPLFFDSYPSAAAGRLVNVGPSANSGESTWNAHQWDVQ